jgi:hypothetical protein
MAGDALSQCKSVDTFQPKRAQLLPGMHVQRCGWKTVAGLTIAGGARVGGGGEKKGVVIKSSCID